MPDTCPHCRQECPDLHTIMYTDAGTYSCTDCLPILVKQSGLLLDVFIGTNRPAALRVVTA